MKNSILIITLAFFVGNVSAQEYDQAIGARLGIGTGITYKKSISDNASLEAIAMFYYGINLTGLYEINRYAAFDVDRLNWYYGGGAHVGSYRGYRRGFITGLENKSSISLGLDGIVGIEYNFIEVPINISLDWKPAFELVGSTGFWGDNVALSVRYML